MYNIIRTIILGRQARAVQRLETDNAALIIEQKIREAEAGHGAAKRGLASLLVRIGSEKRALEMLDTRLADLTARARKALEAGREDLAEEAATHIAEMENERAVRVRTLEGAETKAQRVRLAIERTHRQLVTLRQGLITAQSVERERHAMRNMQGDAQALSAIREGEAVLNRLLGSEDPVAVMDVLDEIEADLSGESVAERLSGEGFGDPLRLTQSFVLDRLKAETKPKTKTKA